jgi:hypothetical protein
MGDGGPIQCAGCICCLIAIILLFSLGFGLHLFIPPTGQNPTPPNFLADFCLVPDNCTQTSELTGKPKIVTFGASDKAYTLTINFQTQTSVKICVSQYLSRTCLPTSSQLIFCCDSTFLFQIVNATPNQQPVPYTANFTTTLAPNVTCLGCPPPPQRVQTDQTGINHHHHWYFIINICKKKISHFFCYSYFL